MTSRCTVCDAATDAYLCSHCADQLDEALGDLPALVDALVTAVARQTHVYRASNRQRQADPDWRGAEHALEPTASPGDLDAAKLLHRAGNALTTWARHLAETRGVTLALTTGQATEGPVCAAHVHDFTTAGCGHDPDACRQLHPGHVHDHSGKGCGHDRDPDTGEPTCQLLHCDHPTCVTIRHRNERTGSAAALVRWFLNHRDTIRYDEAAADMHAEIIRLQADLAKAVDRAPSRLYAGPCHAMVDEVITEYRGGTVYTLTQRGRCERGLYYWAGAKLLRCDGYRSDDDGCGTIHIWASRDRWLMDGIEDALLPLSDLIAAVPGLLSHLPKPPKSVVHSWVRRGLITARTVTPGGIELFRGGDFIDQMRAYRPHKFAPRRARTARMAS